MLACSTPLTGSGGQSNGPMTDSRAGSPVSDLGAVELLGQLAGAAASKDIGSLVVAAVELGRRIERGEVADVTAVTVPVAAAVELAPPPATRAAGPVRCPVCGGTNASGIITHSPDCDWSNNGKPVPPGFTLGPMAQPRRGRAS